MERARIYFRPVSGRVNAISNLVRQGNTATVEGCGEERSPKDVVKGIVKGLKCSAGFEHY